MTNRNILIIGATSGIGHAIATALLAQGANVFAASRRGAEGLPAGVTGITLDATQDFTLPEGFLPAQLHGLVYCPGSINLKPLQRLTANDLMADFNVNTVGAFRSVQACLKALKASGGASVLFFGTVAATLGMGFHASVAAAKGGLEAMARSLAAELAANQIRVNVIAPSLTDTPLAQSLLSTPDKREAGDKRHPLGRVGTVEDMAAAALYLLSPASGWVTGQTLGVDGGMATLK